MHCLATFGFGFQDEISDRGFGVDQESHHVAESHNVVVDAKGRLLLRVVAAVVPQVLIELTEEVFLDFGRAVTMSNISWKRLNLVCNWPTVEYRRAIVRVVNL